MPLLESGILGGCLFVCLLAFQSYVIGDLDFLNPMGHLMVFRGLTIIYHHTPRNVQKEALIALVKSGKILNVANSTQLGV
jgi:hypothetical protein